MKFELIDLLTSKLVTPMDLAENARLDNYEYIKYYQKKQFLIAEMKVIENKKIYFFYYYFDNNNFLQKIKLKINKKINILFSRKKEIEKIKSMEE